MNCNHGNPMDECADCEREDYEIMERNARNGPECYLCGSRQHWTIRCTRKDSHPQQKGGEP